MTEEKVSLPISPLLNSAVWRGLGQLGKEKKREGGVHIREEEISLCADAMTLV